MKTITAALLLSIMSATGAVAGLCPELKDKGVSVVDDRLTVMTFNKDRTRVCIVKRGEEATYKDASPYVEFINQISYANPIWPEGVIHE